MKFIQIVSQTTNPLTREIFYLYKTINVAHIVEIQGGEGSGCNVYFFKTTQGESVILSQRNYHSLISLLESSWEGIRTLAVETIENKGYDKQQ